MMDKMTNGSSKDSEASSSDESSDNRTSPNRKRVNISIDPELHNKGRQYAEDHGKTFSGLITDALLQEMNPSQARPNSIQSQSILRRIENEIDDMQEIINDIHDNVDNIYNLNELDAQVVADRIEEELAQREEPLTTQDLDEELPFPPDRLKQGLSRLESQFVVDRLEAKDETDYTQWRLL